jgi:hypothetical protein
LKNKGAEENKKGDPAVSILNGVAQDTILSSSGKSPF